MTIKNAVGRAKGRREKVFDNLVASIRKLKHWRTSEVSEKEGWKAPWDEISGGLTNL